MGLKSIFGTSYKNISRLHIIFYPNISQNLLENKCDRHGNIQSHNLDKVMSEYDL